MSLKDLSAQQPALHLLQRSLERGRLAHGYLFSGDNLSELETAAAALAKTLNCQRPVQREGRAVDFCGACPSCLRIEHDNHPDVFWIRPESRLRQIRIRQISRRKESPARVLLEFINLKPTESEYKVAIIVAADRMNEDAANAFLKTLEEPPPRSVMILLTTEKPRVLETIVSRCLRLNFGAQGVRPPNPSHLAWLATFSELAATEHKSMLARYRILDALLKKLNEMKEAIDKNLTDRSPLERHPDAESDLKEKWEDELKAAIEAEYRRQRSELLTSVQLWLRDVWLHSLNAGHPSRTLSAEPATLQATDGLLALPQVSGAAQLARRLSPADAVENLRVVEQVQGLLHTNVQEALALEVALLKLRL